MRVREFIIDVEEFPSVIQNLNSVILLGGDAPYQSLQSARKLKQAPLRLPQSGLSDSEGYSGRRN